MDLKLRLANGAEVEIDQFTYPPHIVATCADREAAIDVWDKLTSDALQSFSVMEGETVVAAYDDCTLQGCQYMSNGDGTVTAHFYLTGTRQEGGMDQDYITAAKILMGEEI